MTTRMIEEREAALSWAVRSSDPDFTDWEALADWLAGDPVRNDLYDAAMVAAAEGASLLAGAAERAAPVPPPVRSAPPPGRHAGPRWRRLRLPVRAGAAATLAAGVAAVFLLRTPDHAVPSSPLLVEAPADTVRAVTLADGSHVALAGGARLRIDRAAPRLAVLERGRALFTIRHDEAAPFRVTAGTHVLEDAGTAFEVVQDGGMTRVAVSDGAVIADPAGRALTLRPGQVALLPEGRAAPVMSRVSPDDIGRWQQDRISYRAVPIATVAHDLAIALGRRIDVAGDLSGRRFTGTLVPATLRRNPDELAALLDVQVRVRDGGWELRAR